MKLAKWGGQFQSFRRHLCPKRTDRHAKTATGLFVLPFARDLLSGVRGGEGVNARGHVPGGVSGDGSDGDMGVAYRKG